MQTNKTPEHPDFPGMPAFNKPEFIALGVQALAMAPSVAFAVNENVVATVSPALIVASGDMQADQVAVPFAVACVLPEGEEASKLQDGFTAHYAGQVVSHLVSSGVLNFSRLATYNADEAFELEIAVDKESLHMNGSTLMYFALAVFPSTATETLGIAKTNMQMANEQFTALSRRLLVSASEKNKIH